NGLDLGDPELTAKSIALNYAYVDKRFIERAYRITDNHARYGKQVNVGEIKAEEGMGPALAEKRDRILVQAVVAKPEDFDRVFDAGMKDYLDSGGRAIIEERRVKYEQFYE
ncbi:MAG TPA: sugar ABC transporter substrate-binding protein, partial [Bacillota bacterium]